MDLEETLIFDGESTTKDVYFNHPSDDKTDDIDKIDSDLTSELKDYIKKPLVISNIPPFIFDALCLKSYSFWIKLQNQKILTGLLQWLSNKESCPLSHNCPYFCSAAIDTDTSPANSNGNSYQLHIMLYHWNEIQHFPIIIGNKRSKTNFRIKKKDPKKSIKPLGYMSALKYFNEKVICPKIFPVREERDQKAKSISPKMAHILFTPDRKETKDTS